MRAAGKILPSRKPIHSPKTSCPSGKTIPRKMPPPPKRPPPPPPPRQYAPEKAAFHAKKAGLGTADVTLSASDAAFNGAIDMSVLFQATAGAGGPPGQGRGGNAGGARG